MNSLTRRQVLRLGLAGLAGGLLAACGGQATSTPTPAKSSGAATSPTATAQTPTTAATATKATTATASTASGSSKTIRIGVIFPLTGTAASVGNDAKQAVQLAVQLVNEGAPDIALPLAKGGGLPNLGGAKVELVFGDSQGKAEVGQSEAERLIKQEKVVALLGCYQSAVTKTASAVAERAGIPLVNGDSSSPALTEQGYQWFFRTSPHDGDFSKIIMEFLQALTQQKNAGIKTVSLLYEDTDFGVNSAQALKAEAQAHGLQVVGEVKYKANATSLTTEVQTLKGQNADALVPSSYTNDAILTIKTAQQLGYLPKMIVAQDAGYADPAFISGVGANIAEGMCTRSAFSVDITQLKPAAAKVNELYKKAAGKDIYDVPARDFTAMLVLLDAINRAGSTDPAAIKRALEATNLGPNDTIMPWKGVKFDSKHQNTLGTGIILQIRDGQYRTVYPFDVKTIDVTFPLKPWNQR